MRRPGPDGGRARGSVTAEFAIGLPAVVVVLVAAILTATAAIGQLRCADAARAGARAAALGADVAQVRDTSQVLAGPGAAVAVVRDGSWVVVRVTKPLAATGWVAGSWAAGGLVARGEARAWVEPVADGERATTPSTGAGSAVLATGRARQGPS